jgi:uncharacterized protein YciI
MSQSIVSAQDIIEESKRRGYLAKQLYVVFTSPTNGIGPVMENLAAHLEFQEKLEREGIMFAAGPQENLPRDLGDDTGLRQRTTDRGGVPERKRSLVSASASFRRSRSHPSHARKHRSPQHWADAMARCVLDPLPFRW